MATRLILRLKSHLPFSLLIHHRLYTISPPSIYPKSPPSIFSNSPSPSIYTKSPPSNSILELQRRLLSSSSRRGGPTRPKPIDIGARARQLQTRRLWTYALTFSCIAGFIVIVLNSFQEQLVFYVTPTDALQKYATNPSKSKFRLGGLVLEGSVVQPASSPEMEFVITDLITDILVRYKGSLPDLFREGHSVVVEGFVKPFSDDVRKEVSNKGVSGKARSIDCYFSATEVLAKHDEKYMPGEVAAAIEKNKKTLLDAEAEAKANAGGDGGEQAAVQDNADAKSS